MQHKVDFKNMCVWLRIYRLVELFLYIVIYKVKWVLDRAVVVIVVIVGDVRIVQFYTYNSILIWRLFDKLVFVQVLVVAEFLALEEAQLFREKIF